MAATTTLARIEAINLASPRTSAKNEDFVAPSFSSRVKSMLSLDFYRLFHTPLFYIMLAIAAMIPAMVLALASGDMQALDAGAAAVGTGAAVAGSGVAVSSAAGGVTQSAPEFTNAWQMIESTGGSAAGANPLDFGGYANINMLFIFAGLLMAIFVAHDYSSGFVKNIFAVHSKKIDYVICKTAIGVFSGAAMIITYVIGTVLAGQLTGKAFDVEVGGLVFCLISKMLLMGVFCSLFLSIAVFFRNKLWLTIVFTFLFGMMLYPAASVATLNSTILTVLIALAAGSAGALGFGAVSSLFLKKRDLA